MLESVSQMFEWLSLALGLIAVAGIFATISFAGYFAIHERKEKDIKNLEKKRVQNVRTHLLALARKCKTEKEVTKEIEKEYQDLFDNEYSQAHEPSRVLTTVDLSFLIAGALFIVTALLDWADTNFTFFLSVSLAPFESQAFFFGILMLGVGLFSLERLRRMTTKEDVDPAPLGVTIMLAVVLVLDVGILWSFGLNYNGLSPIGKSLFYSTLLPFIGFPLAVFTWDDEDWKRILGAILLFAPYFLLLGLMILTLLHLVP